MSSLTNFLKLFKWDTKTDGSQKFDIDKALNGNWDKTDEAIENAQKTTITTAISEEITVTDCAEVNAKLDIKNGKTIQDGTPTPEAPIEIRNVNSINIKTSNANLYGSEVLNQNIRGVDCVFSEDSTLKMNGTATGSGGRTDTKNLSKITLKKGKKYTMYVEKVSGTGTTSGIYLNAVSDNTSIKLCNENKAVLFTVTEDIDVYWGVNVLTNYVYDNLLLRIGLYEGVYTFDEIKNMFVIHKGKTITFPLAEGKVLHNRDYLANDGIHQNKQTCIFDGTETIGAYKINEWTDDYAAFYINYISKYKNMITSNIYDKSTHLTRSGTLTSNLSIANINKFYIHTNGVVYIEIPKSIAINAVEFKNWLQEQYANGTPLIIEGTLATEQVIPYTTEQEEAYYQLQHLLMYEGYTNISCVNEIKPDMQLTYYYNNLLNKSYAKRFDELEEKIRNLQIGG